jgi:serine/threonine-protein kinase
MEPSTVPESELRAALERVLASAAFRGRERPSRLLRFIVQAALAGRAEELKEYTLGAEALGRGDRFDPRIDPIARVEASRLRTRLELYYAGDGRDDPVTIVLPKGGYAPRFLPRAPANADVLAAGPRLWAIAGACAAGAVFAAAAIAWTLGRGAAPVPAPLQVEVAIGASGAISSDVGSSVAISPDGRTLALSVMHPDGTTHLYVRPLESLAARELPGTTGARGPFFSPDGRWIAFHAQSQLKKVLAAGGASPVTLAATVDFLGGDWGEDGYIVAALDREGVLWRIPENGGEPTALLEAEDGSQARWPQLLPGGRAVLFTTTGANASRTSIDVARLPGGERTTLVQGGTFARYVASGHIVYVDGGALFAAPFDARALRVTGSPVPVIGGVSFSPGFGFAQYDVSASGVLAYARAAGEGQSTLAWLTADGGTAPLLDELGSYLWPRFSPDGDRLAYVSIEGGDPDLWVLDVATGSRLRLISGEGGQSAPLWTPDGARLVFMDDRAPQLMAQRADGAEPARALLPPGVNVPWSLSPDGRIAYYAMSSETGLDLWTARIADDDDGLAVSEPELFRRTRFMESYPAFSPDGRWIAYASEESGAWEVWVRAFPDDGRAVRVSSAGGRVSTWSRASDEIVYETSDHRLMAARVAVSDGVISVEPARPWSPVRLFDTGVIANFDVAPDGRVVAAVPAGDSAADGPHVTLVTDFAASLGRR